MHIYGIRHHGPGSARTLLKALAARVPDVLLVEAPADAESCALSIDPEQLTLPVALLLFNVKNRHQATFYPFAEFSPEWQALCWARRNGVPVRFMDLPFSRTLNPVAQVEVAPEFAPRQPDSGDPLSAIALLDGYSDPERWWEARIERAGDCTPLEAFDTVLTLMNALREARPDTSTETLVREAWMRQTIRQAQKDGFRSIAVVCGAWHGPALATVNEVRPKDDESLLKPLLRIPTECLWVPWSFERLARQSGYGAGVTAPAWYRLLWQYPDNASVHWMARAARLLRAHDLNASAAQVLDAGRLADTLAALRNTAQPGMEELREAAGAVLGEGGESVLALLDEELVIGTALGAVPHQAGTLPLIADFDAQIKSLRLKQETAKKTLKLDLRQVAHLHKSRFLHRLCILEVPWGEEADAGDRLHGGFHEHWEMHWRPDYLLTLIEAAAWGNTVEAAAHARMQHQLQVADSVPALVRHLRRVLTAELPGLLPGLLRQLQGLSAQATDALLLADALPPLVSALRYGSARNLNVDVLYALIADWVPRTCVLFPAACKHLSDEHAEQVKPRLPALHHSIDILQNPDFRNLWHEALQHIAESTDSARALAGLCCRLLFDRNVYHADDAGRMLQFECSGPPRETAGWLTGFLHGGALLLLHHPALWRILDGWVRALDADAFVDLLPLLRRSFSTFSGPERQKLLGLALARPDKASGRTLYTWDPDLVGEVEPVLQSILGLKKT
ncbi:MAG: DUF5682 family protein [Saprospiraceae bacterium]|nr:DUF5682 family protein [Saprospiraceae bacterium]